MAYLSICFSEEPLGIGVVCDTGTKAEGSLSCRLTYSYELSWVSPSGKLSVENYCNNGNDIGQEEVVDGMGSHCCLDDIPTRRHHVQRSGICGCNEKGRVTEGVERPIVTKQLEESIFVGVCSRL
jgi:hypothetical protein